MTRGVLRSVGICIGYTIYSKHRCAPLDGLQKTHLRASNAVEYRRTGFNCKNLIIANGEFFLEFANFDLQNYSINSPPLRAICADAIITFAM